MAEEMKTITLDLRGAALSEPLARVTQAIQEAGPGQSIEAIVDSVPAVLSITGLTIQQPWDIDVRGVSRGVWKLTLTRRQAGVP